MGIGIGLVVGLVLGIVFSVALDFPNLTIQPTAIPTPTPTAQPNSVDYTRVKVLSGGVEHITIDGDVLTITYKWWGQGAITDDGEFTISPIEIDVGGSDIGRILPPIQDRTYNIAGIEVKVSEVYDEYVILLLK